MLSLDLAKELKDAGLDWTPEQRDFFAIPERGMDDSIFVLNLMLVGVARIHGDPVIAFYGTVEHAIDFLPFSEAVWLPSEAQLRTLVEDRLAHAGAPNLNLNSTSDGYRCQIDYLGQTLLFEGFGVAEVYGQALLHILTQQAAQ